MRNHLAFFQSFDPFLNTVSTNGPQSSCCFTIASHHIGVQVLHNNNITNRSKLSNYAWYYESYWKERFHCCSSVSFQCMCQQKQETSITLGILQPHVHVLMHTFKIIPKCNLIIMLYYGRDRNVHQEKKFELLVLAIHVNILQLEDGD